MTGGSTRRELLRIGPRDLLGEWVQPPQPRGAVVFAHGSGSSRRSPRNRLVAEVLQGYGLATLLFDLLTEGEATDRRRVFDIDGLGERIVEVLDALPAAIGPAELRTGLFGASTGAAAAVWAAARRPDQVAAIVSRGGRPDLAGDDLERVRAPTLLIVGADDTEVLALNRLAYSALACDKHLEVVPGATHLFDEPGTLEAVARLAGAWFVRHLAPGSSR